MSLNMSMTAAGSSTAHACGCVGPQNGQPLCPCRMRGVKEVDGRWVEVIDYGPVSTVSDDSFREFGVEIAKQIKSLKEGK